MRQRIAKLLRSYANWLERDHKWAWTIKQLANAIHETPIIPVAQPQIVHRQKRGNWR